MPRDLPPSPPAGGSLHRHPALVELSRDHHHALVQALALRRAADPEAPDPGATVDAFFAFVERDLLGHFADEEDVLLPISREVAPQESARVASEHREIRALIDALRAAGTANDVRARLLQLGELLHDHVRYEERALFERLQQTLSPQALDSLGRTLEEHRRARGRAPGCALG